MRSLAGIGAVALAATLLLAATACASSTKAGGTVTHPITLTMQASDGPDTDANSTYFISQVRKRSGGRIRMVLGSTYPSSDARNEPRLVRALRSGKVQMAYIPSRAWEEASPVTAFRALQAPLLVTNYPLLRRIITGRIGHSMLMSLNSIGVVGLGLVPERLRRLLGPKPLDSAKTLHGARIRPVTSPTGEMALRALGAVSVTIPAARAAGPAMGSGQIDGVESETISIENNDYLSYAHDLTANIALFAKATTIAIRKSVFDRLSGGDQRILRAAAEATVAHADPAAAERADMQALCRQGIKPVTATPADLASLQPLALRAYPPLESDAITRREIRAIEHLKKHTTPAVSDVPLCPSAPTNQSGSTSGGPTGTYVMTASMSEVAKSAGHHDAGDNYGSFRLVLHDGRFRISDRRPAGELVQGASSGFSTGTYAIQGDRITFTTTAATGDTPMGPPGADPVICRWSRYRHQLTFHQLPAAAQATASAHGLDAGGPPVLYVKPWLQVGRTSAPASSVFPTGTFETKITVADLRGTGFPANNAHWETLTFRKNGTWRDVWFHPRRPDQPPAGGHYSVQGSVITLTPANPDVLHWSYDRGQLTFRVVSDPDRFGRFTYTAHPWRKIK
jgi:TRAP-type C4-dicarboxylate transport system substrate-binding protein